MTNSGFAERALYRRILASAAWIAVAAIATAGGAADLATSEAVVAEILSAAGIDGGLVVHVNCGDGELTAALAADEGLLVQGLDADADHVARARERLESQGVYGRASVDRFDGRRLPYAQNLANLVVAEDLGGVTIDEVMRVLAPGGTACIKQGGAWRKTVKPRPDDIDEWTHYLHDAGGNAVAADRQIGPPKHVRWIAGPHWSRSHEFNPSLNGLVSDGRRMFYIFDEGIAGLPDLRLPERWSLIARDAFSGVFLWKRPVPNWGYRRWNTRGMWSAPLTLNRRVVTDGERVYVTLGYKAPVTVLDAATGDVIRTLEGTDGTDEMVLCDGVLLALVRDELSVASEPKKQQQQKRRQNPNEFTIGPPGAGAVVALDADSGRELWRAEAGQVTLLTLAADGGRVSYHGEEGLVCLDMKTGKRQWAVASPPSRGSRHSGGTLVMHDGVVLFTSGQGIVAYSAETGEHLWSGPKVQGPGITHPPDLFVADGIVWGGDLPGMNSRERTAVVREGYDLKTGEVRRTLEVPFLFSPLHHVRCYRSKATERFLLLTKRGVEFLDLEGEENMRNDWLRAMCHYGFMPANGLLYVPPHHCFCYPGVKMTGFLALSSEADYGQGGEPSEPPRLERGPAYEDLPSPASGRGYDWPTYRRDPLRSGHTEAAVPTSLEKAWQAELGGRISQPVLSDGRLFVAQRDRHRVVCLDANSGKTQWSFTAGGPVDSAPTIHEGRVLFGCRDGWVYCLRAADGALAWRFRAAPEERRIVAFDQIESPWPVPGSVLLLDGVAYAAAGRSSFLDGGVSLYGLKPETGEVLYQTRVGGPWPDVEKEVGRPFDMDGVLGDVLVTDGTNIYLLQMTFTKQLEDVTPPRASELGDRVTGRHLIATGGFLDDTWFDRTYWTYSNRWPGFYYANDAPKAGQILVFDEKTTYGLHVFTDRLRLSPAFTPGAEGYELFADDNANEPVLAPNSINREKGPGFSREAPPKWSKQIQLRAQAMVLAGDKLFMAGPPDVMPEDDPYASFDGRLGAELWAVSAANGEKLAVVKLDSLPAVDGLIAAPGRLFLSTRDGRVIAFAGK